VKRTDLTEKLLDIKREKGWTWKHICEQIGGYSEVLITGAILGQMKLTKPQAANAQELFGLSKSETAMLNEVPMRGEGTPMPPTDPLIYRFYEMVMVGSRSRCPENSCRTDITAPAATCRNMGSRRDSALTTQRSSW
jgi:cyanate lyase